MQPERRKHVRILTIRNVGWTMLVLVLVLAAANVISEMRKPRPGEFGRLTLDAKPVVVKHPQVVTEEEVPDVTPAGPATTLLSVAPAPPPAVLSAHQPEIRAGEGAGATQKRVISDHVAIVGGPDGVHVESSQHSAAPKLSGGIFRQ